MPVSLYVRFCYATSERFETSVRLIRALVLYLNYLVVIWVALQNIPQILHQSWQDYSAVEVII